MGKGIKAAICLLLGATLAAAVNTGDELFSKDTSGTFYVFADQTIQIIDPLNLTVVANITSDQYGYPLTNQAGGKNVSKIWNDAVFVQNATAGTRLVYINEGDVYTEPNNGPSYSFVIVVDATNRRIVGRVKVGPRPVHVYAVNATSKAWVHSDAEGNFYVLSGILNNGSWSFNKTVVPSFVNTGGHGKLTINDALYPLAYGTNTAEAYVSKFDLSNDTRIATIAYNSSLSDPSSCPGTHSTYYSRINKHVYFECTSGGGVLEWNTVSETLVRQHNIIGTLQGTPRDDRIFVTSSSNSSSTVLAPGENGVASTVERVISISSQPGDPVFYSNSSSITPERYPAYTAYFPTARNTNLNNIAAAGSDVTTASYMTRPTDCRYSSDGVVSTNSVGTVGTGLQLAVGNGQVLTPECGACAPGIETANPSQFNASLAGFGVIEVNSAANSTTLIPAGAVLPVRSQASTANECSFATVSRAAKRGGAFVVTLADLPQPSLYVLAPAQPGNQTYGAGFVATAASPKKVVWVPNQAAVLTG